MKPNPEGFRDIPGWHVSPFPPEIGAPFPRENRGPTLRPEFGHFGRGVLDPVLELALGDAKARVEPRCLLPVRGQGFDKPGRTGHDRSRGLHASPQVAEQSNGRALVRLPRVVGKAARDLEEAEPPRWGRDC